MWGQLGRSHADRSEAGEGLGPGAAGERSGWAVRVGGR